MQIQIREAGKRSISIKFPTGLAGLVLNRFSANLLVKNLKGGIRMDKKQARFFIKAVKRYRKTHKGWCLVEVEAADGDKVQILL